MKNKIYIVIGTILLVILLVLFITYKLIFPANGNVNKAVSYLESEGYECEKVTNPFIFTRRGEYVCEDEDRDDNVKKFIINWHGGVTEFFSNLLNSKELFDSSIYLDFYYYNNDNDYVYISPESLDEYYALVMLDEKTGDTLCTYWAEGGSEDNRIFLNDKDVEVDYDDCNNGYSSYVNDLNDSLDDIRDLLEELDME